MVTVNQYDVTELYAAKSENIMAILTNDFRIWSSKNLSLLKKFFDFLQKGLKILAFFTIIPVKSLIIKTFKGGAL
jgi:hypothetical protein